MIFLGGHNIYPCHEVKQLMARIEEAEMLVATSTSMSHAAPEKSNNIENDQLVKLDLLKELEEFSQVFKGNDELMTDWKNTTAENIDLKAEHVETKHQLFLALDENFRLVEEKDQTSADFAKQIHELSEQLQASREETRALVLQDAGRRCFLFTTPKHFLRAMLWIRLILIWI